MAVFTYTKPTVGGSEDTWGTTLNANWDALGTFLGALDSTELALLDGATIALADITATAAELNYTDGVTSAIQTQLDAKSTAAATETLTNKTLTAPVINGAVTGDSLATQVEAEAGTNNDQLMTPLRTAQAIAALADSAAGFTESLGAVDSTGYTQFPNGLIVQWGRSSVVAGGSSLVTLPIAFPTAHIGGQATVNRTSAVSGAYSIYYDTASLTQCRLTSDTVTASSTQNYYWLAYGH